MQQPQVISRFKVGFINDFEYYEVEVTRKIYCNIYNNYMEQYKLFRDKEDSPVKQTKEENMYEKYHEDVTTYMFNDKYGIKLIRQHVNAGYTSIVE